MQRQPIEAGEVLIPGTTVKMKSRVGENSLVPRIDPQYFFRQALVEEVDYAVRHGENCLLVGTTGAGKSSLIEQLAAITNTPLRRVNLHGESDTALFVGRDQIKVEDGQRTIVYQWGILARAMLEGYWLLLDEVDAALQPVLFVLQGVLEDQGKLVLEDGHGTVVRKHPDFRIFATANTVGVAGKDRLLYTGTMSRMNEATLDRFGVVVHVEELGVEEEVGVIKQKVPELDEDFVKAIVRVARDVRSQLSKELLTCTFSTRRCIQWAAAMTRFSPRRSARLTVLNKLGVEDAKVLEGVIQRYFGG